ncbi:MAG: MgtC/SapB family protein [Alphaproteobacteria bacterium]|nr:MgtC/SapB family protein [Alphaproteobacteria bacterium]
MPVEISWADAVLRLALAFVAGAVVGFNRSERSEAAGMRTTILVCLAAAIAGVLANLLLHTTGKDQGYFTQMDVLRLPLGILSGIGFIGAGAIIKKGDMAIGVTTASTIWYMSVVGLCFGLGQLLLGAVASAIALIVLWLLRWFDLKMARHLRAVLCVQAAPDLLAPGALRDFLQQRDYRILRWAVEWANGKYTVHASLQWEGEQEELSLHPLLLSELAQTEGVIATEWNPATPK